MIDKLKKLSKGGKFKISKEKERIFYFYTALGFFCFYLINIIFKNI